LTTREAKIINKIVGESNDIFDSKPGRVKFMEYDIIVNKSYVPKGCVPYKIPFHLKEKVRDEIHKWLDTGLIQKSNSRYVHPMVIVKNSDDSLRLTVDYRSLNPHVETDNYPMPLIDDVIEKLSNAKFISKVDLTKAYFNLGLNESSHKYTSFITEFGQYEFKVVPFGIKFASGLCNRIINQILEGCENFVGSFVDDLVIYSNNFEDHVKHLDFVLRRLKDNGLTLNRRKCTFAAETVKFLGFIVGQGKITPDPAKLNAIANFPRPITKKNMRSFVGLVNFYRKFAPYIAAYLSPLNDCLKKTFPDKIIWSETLIDVFNTVINIMVKSTPLYIPKLGYNFILQTDACDYAVAAVLWQRTENGDRPIAFASKKLQGSQLSYPIIEKECLAIKYGIEYFREYLLCSEFLVKTDHSPLQWLYKNKNTASRRMRWALELQMYSFRIEFVRGKDNFLADILSRFPPL
jgi:hypothetical protein